MFTNKNIHYSIVFSSEKSLRNYIELCISELKKAGAINKIKIQSELNFIYKTLTGDINYSRVNHYKQGLIK